MIFSKAATCLFVAYDEYLNDLEICKKKRTEKERNPDTDFDKEGKAEAEEHTIYFNIHPTKTKKCKNSPFLNDPHLHIVENY